MSAHSTLNDDRDWQHMLQYLDGSLPPSDVARLNERLRQDARLRAVFADLLVQQIKLEELEQESAALAEETALAESAGNIIRLNERSREAIPASEGTIADQATSQPGKRSKILAGLAVAAMIAFLVSLTVLLLQPATVVTITELDGAAVIERGDRRFTATVGERIRDGDQLVTTLTSRVRIAYPAEATHIDLDPSTRLGIGLIGDAKHLELTGGAISAEVAPQAPGSPLTIATPHSQATVVGTRFRLSTESSATRLAVLEGAVSIRHDAADPGLLVESGRAVRIEPGLPSRLARLSSERGSILLEEMSADGDALDHKYLNQLMLSGVGVAPGGSRVRGYLHPPRSGAYSFQLTSTGPAELWLADSARPETGRMIAKAEGGTGESGIVQLQAGQAHYLEVRLNAANLPPSFTLSWTMPGGIRRVVYGEHLSPFDPTE